MEYKLNPCPFCGGSAKLSFREADFAGKNHIGDKKSKYIFYVTCKKCHSRGSPIKTDYLINANPWGSMWSGRDYLNEGKVAEKTEEYRKWAEAAIESWNRCPSKGGK